jgi:hypothetical protein
MCVRDLAIGLRKRGHVPIIYSSHLDELAQELRSLTIQVVDDLNALDAPPDLIHGHHHLETMMAVLHFPGVPAVYFCHNAFNWFDSPPLFPRVRRYVAVDQDCYDNKLSNRLLHVRVVCPAIAGSSDKGVTFLRSINGKTLLQSVKNATE